jgi:uncharacterized 2Fe-2S/4Fe-4S cluster protein (DUF4445 family)
MNPNQIGWVHSLSLPQPSLKDNTGDADRLLGALKTRLDGQVVECDFELLKHLPELLRKCRYRIRAVVIKDRNRWRIAGVADAADSAPMTGVAVDLGTSRVVMKLIDLSDGATLGEISFDNPQLEIGPDILARIHFSETEGGLEKLTGLIVDGINRYLAQLCSSCGLHPDTVYLMTVAGNTAMTHLLLCLNPRWIIREPYIPAVNRPGIVSCRKLGITVNPFAKALIFPNIGSYFGGDLVSGILYSGMHRNEEIAILVDVGTNAEVVLGNSGWLMACAGAAGPALEGGVTRMGMMAGPGAIDKVSIDPRTRTLKFRTIGNQSPVGICGSGLIDLAAALFMAGMVDIRAKFVENVCGDRLVKKNGMNHYVVVSADQSATGEELMLSQADLDSLIRSKAAMFTILETITGTVGMSMHELKTFYVAGTFGSFIDPGSAITIGMIPDLPLEAYKTLGNSSLGGAALVLTHPEAIDDIDRIRDRITYLELNVNQDFMNRFSAAKFLPHTDRSRFPSVSAGSFSRRIP